MKIVPLAKLKQNLKQSQGWTNTFKQQIKQQMQEVTLKTQQICRLAKANIQLEEQISRMKTELKVAIEKQTKDKYRADRESIRVEQISNRVQLFLEIQEKKRKWNEELVNKVGMLQKQIKNERSNRDVSFFRQNHNQKQDSSFSNIISNQTPLKVISQQQEPIEVILKRIKNIQREGQLQRRHLRSVEEKLEVASRKGQKLRELIKQIEERQCSEDKENNSIHNRYPIQQQKYRSNISIEQQFDELQKQNKKLTDQIVEKHKHIDSLSTTLKLLVGQDNESNLLHQQVSNLDREVKKQKLTANTLRSYIIQEVSLQ